MVESKAKNLHAATQMIEGTGHLYFSRRRHDHRPYGPGKSLDALFSSIEIAVNDKVGGSHKHL